MSAQPESRSARHQLTRGWLAALAATSPAALSHGLADGHAVAPLPLAVALVLAACVCVPLVGRRISKLRMTTAVLASQALFHGLFAIAGHCSPLQLADVAGHAHHGTGLDAYTLAAMAEHAQPVVAPSLLMLFGHLAAAVLTLAALWYAERLARAILSTAFNVVARLVALLTPVRPISAARMLPVATNSTGWPTVHAPRLGGLRGPPVLV